MYSMMKMGPMMRAIRFSTYQKLLDIDSDMPTKPAYYELLYNHMHDPRPQTWYPTFKKLSEVRKRVLAKHDGGVIGDYLCQYGPSAMHLMTIIYYPSPSVRMELAEEMMMDPICHEMTHLIKNIECKGMLPVPGLECRFK
ncbi:PREDICTED: uncharacterized protein LOC106810546 [Priapulus caudatus]|uniref:Uncharacterized protein LOC106810546 n=1 Tax=Priapulus caudatus TaxID=37621 RepID=A0ABM1EB40_PRICU|nr:PREDICTED: uncharacterized protein LOC106810546 [Priapulus caudatus]